MHFVVISPRFVSFPHLPGLYTKGIFISKRAQAAPGFPPRRRLRFDAYTLLVH